MSAPRAHAQYGATAEVERPIPAGSSVDPTAASTVVDARDRGRALETTDELLLEVPGARARRSGGLGAFTGVSLRGANLRHTTVLFDDVPIGPVGGGSFDLSTIPLSVIERVEVYRGGAPLWLGAGGIGGVVRLVPRQQQGTYASGTFDVGSFGTRGGHVSSSVVSDDIGWTAVVGGRHTDGDYPFVDDRGTRFDTSDDVTRRRQNAQLDEGWGLLRAELPLAGGTLDLIATAYGRTGGLTGSPVEEPTRTHRKRTRVLGVASWETEASDVGNPWRLRLTASGSSNRNQLTDRFAEIATAPRVTDDHTWRTSWRSAAEVELTDHLTLAGVGSYTFARYEPHDARARRPAGDSQRHTLAVGTEARLHGHLGDARAELRASARLETLRSQLVDIRPGTANRAASTTTVAPTARLGVVVEPWRGIAWSASVATETRPPSLVELFGDRGFLLGETGLQAERSVTGDTGIVARGRAGPVDGSLEARLFASRVEDLIRYVRTAQFRLAPQNVARATLVGAELGARGRIGRHVRLTGSLTWLHTRDRHTGRELPLRPPLQGYARPELTIGPYGVLHELSLYGEVTHVSSNFTDRANRVTVPPRTLLGAGIAAELFARRVRIEASVRDALDERPFDLVGFPLPGRRFALELTLRTGEP